MLTILQRLKEQNYISQLDYYFAELINSKQQAYSYPELENNLAVLLAALVSYAVQKGHSCLILTELDDFFDLNNSAVAREYLTEIKAKIEYKPSNQWQQTLANHIAFTIDPTQPAPMLFMQDLLYFYRYFDAENDVADYLVKAVKTSHLVKQPQQIQQIKNILQHLFPNSTDAIDWQQIAVASALTQKFTLISGGPGTGKTTTVCKLLVALQQVNPQKLKLRFAAPTGKAAARLTESIQQTLASPELQSVTELAQLDIQPAQTIHKLLKVNFRTGKPKYDAQNKLSDVQVLIVDEASMIDLSLMQKLIQALAEDCKLILLGDKDQLSSVEGGAIIGELGSFYQQKYSPEQVNYIQQTLNQQLPFITDAAAIIDHICVLQHSYRFSGDSGIGKLAAAVNSSDKELAWELLDSELYPDVKIKQQLKNKLNQPTSINNNQAEIIALALEFYTDYLQAIKAKKSVQEIFNLFNQVKILSAIRETDFGVNRLNEIIAYALKQAELVYFKQPTDLYIGRPIIITKNDYNTNLANGDIGIVLEDENKQKKIYFIQDEIKAFSVQRISDYETAFAMTVHKAQGSEFERVGLILNPEYSAGLSKELIYTAITRAKKQFSIFSSKDILDKAIETKTARQSGLARLINTKLNAE